MDIREDSMFQAAVDAQTRAYAPYSGFQVGASVQCADGTIVTGANVENAAYPLGCCAERTALYTAAAMGHREFVRMVVVGPGPEVISPCGGCRQVMAEFGDFEVVMAEATGRTPARIMRVADLLPARFTKEDLDGV